MHPFEYIRVTDVRHAVATAAAVQGAAFLAGGTTQVDLMKDGVLAPQVLIDITGLPLRGVTAGGGVLRVGALTTMEELAADPVVTQRLPVVVAHLLPEQRCVVAVQQLAFQALPPKPSRSFPTSPKNTKCSAPRCGASSIMNSSPKSRAGTAPA